MSAADASTDSSPATVATPTPAADHPAAPALNTPCPTEGHFTRYPGDAGTFLAPRAWHAAWLAGHGGDERNVFRLFRTELKLEAADLAAAPLLAYIAADTRYQLWVNGRFAGRGAPQSQPHWQYYDTRDLTPLLRPGANCIAVLVNFLGILPETRLGLLLELVNAQGRTVAATGDGWRTQRASAWRGNAKGFRMNLSAHFQEHLDTRQLPQGWTEAGFDDRDWAPASVVRKANGYSTPPAAGHCSLLLPRDIPDMTDTPVRALAIERADECVHIANRTHSEDLSPMLTQAGRPLELTTITAPEALLAAADIVGTDGAVLQCSTAHLDGIFDGIWDPCITFDFGEIVTAYPRLTVDGPTGATLMLGYAERLIDGHFNNNLEGCFADSFTLRGGPQRLQPLTWKSFRYLRLRLCHCTTPLRLQAVEAVVTTYPFAERGSFQSADATLNAVWRISRQTLRLCANEFIMDTPWREQAQWLGDVAAVTLGGLYSCFGDTALAGKFIRQAAANQYPTGMVSNVSNSVSLTWNGAIPDYSLWYVMAIWELYRYTGEPRWLHHLYPTVCRIMEAHTPYHDADGLLANVPWWVFIDWAHLDHAGASAAYNAIYYGALEAYVAIADFKGDSWTADRARSAMAGIRASFQTRFYDPARGALADAHVDGVRSPMTSEHANLAAIRWGLVDAPTVATILHTLYRAPGMPDPRRITEAQPFFMVVVLQALDRVGEFDLALQLLRDRWGRMVDKGATSCYEEWGINGSWRGAEYSGFNRTQSHAWSACPAEFLIRQHIGLEILEPGCARIRVAPRSTGDAYEVTMPLPQGPLTVRHTGTTCTVHPPPGVTLA